MMGLAYRGPELRLRIGRSSLRAEAVEHGSVTWAGEASYGELGELTDAIARVVAEPPRACRRLVVTLDRPAVQVRTLTELPPVKAKHLVALVAQQAGRFFRKNGQALITDAAWVGRGPTRLARAAAVEEPLVEAIAAGARAAGLWLESIAPAGEGGPPTLPPQSERRGREGAPPGRTQRLALGTCALLLCGFRPLLPAPRLGGPQ